MTYGVVATAVKRNGELQLPMPVRKALRLRSTGDRVRFVISGPSVLLTASTIAPKSTFSDDEIAFLADLSKRGVGKRTFRTKAGALRHLWSL
jgi:hypothetical protein